MCAELCLKGPILGIVNAAPIGPVGLLCLRKNLTARRGPGLAAGMAAAYAIVAFCVILGLKTISPLLEEYAPVFQLGGGLLLMLVGWKGLHANPDVEFVAKGNRCLGDFSASFAMTLFNPTPFTAFAVILTAYPLHSTAPSTRSDLVFAFSVAVGTLSFWFLLNELIHHARRLAPAMVSLRIARATSIIVFVLGFFVAASGMIRPLLTSL